MELFEKDLRISKLSNTIMKNPKHAIFKLKPTKNTNTAIIKCVGHINDPKDLIDEPLECTENEDKYTYNITETIYTRFYACNILDTYVMTSKSLPVLYASIMYKTNIICGLLFNIFIYFIIKSEVKSERQLIGTNLDGEYQLHIKTNDKDQPKIIKLNQYDGTRFTIEMMKTLIETDEIKSIIAKLMEERRKERLDRLGITDTNIDIPKPKYNFTELVDKYKKNGEIVFNN